VQFWDFVPCRVTLQESGCNFASGLITFQFHPIIAGVIVYGIGTPNTMKLGDTTAPVFLHDSYEMFKCLQKVQ